MVSISTPVQKLKMKYARGMVVNDEEYDLEPVVYIHEGSELMAQLRDQLALLPELLDLSPVCDIDKADVGESGENTVAQEDKPKGILKYQRTIFPGDAYAAPPARGVELLKKRLETGLIEHSESPWASPIVIVFKNNSIEIRMGIDYRVVNSFIQLSSYPLPLIDDLLIGFEGAMWFMSLDMASCCEPELW
ncbi:unnamed protein product [Phytophthora fragariaefolia]|uniref:Unnamed protein product n=1 Tax=Phytophthora fragariaefolia TaxID=1490495 RepID=A0A9W7D115_9STRA|nr:unnamed protein product [Phytophthora fragariaefolia]